MQALLHFLSTYGLPALFLVILLEYACFPISSEIVLPLSGAIAAAGHLPYPVLILLSTLAGLIGTSLVYAIGRYGGSTLLDRIQHRFPKARKSILASQEKFMRFGFVAVLFGRVIPLCRTYIAFVAGASGMKWLPYLISSLLGIAVWNSILTGIGYFMQDNWTLATALYEKYKDVSLPLLLIVALLLIMRYCKKLVKKQTNQK